MIDKEPQYGFVSPPEHAGNPCNCGDLNCPMPKAWEDHWEVWIPLLKNNLQESFLDKYCMHIAVLCAFLLGVIVF